MAHTTRGGNVSETTRFLKIGGRAAIKIVSRPEPADGAGVPGFQSGIRPEGGVVYSMSNSSELCRKPAPEGAGQDEARLRQQAIGVKLRHMFDEVVNEPVPDEFLEILRRADERSSGGEGA